jgi:hypothetical protein
MSRGNYPVTRVIANLVFARKVQAMTGHPSDTQFTVMVSNISIKNCLIKPEHISNALSIFSPSITGVQGKTVRQAPAQVEGTLGQIPDNFFHNFFVLTAVSYAMA